EEEDPARVEGSSGRQNTGTKEFFSYRDEPLTSKIKQQRVATTKTVNQKEGKQTEKQEDKTNQTRRRNPEILPPNNTEVVIGEFTHKLRSDHVFYIRPLDLRFS